MQRVLGLCLLSLAAAAYSQAQATTTTRHSNTAASSSTSASKKKTAATHGGATSTSAKTRAKTGSRGRTVSAKGRKARAKPAPSYQLHPDPERYQQIQQALTDRGYFKGPVNGEWGDDSVEALKKFQGDQKLDTDGKINALSLIGLGLGPKHDGTSGHDAPVPPRPPGPDSPVTAPAASTPEVQSPPPTPPN